MLATGRIQTYRPLIYTGPVQIQWHL